MDKSQNQKAVDRLISSALAIAEQDALDAGELGFMARAMVQATLPHKKAAGNEFSRKNGNYTLTLLAPSKIDTPAAVKPTEKP